MNVAQNVIQGVSGGIIAGALLGLSEALFHLWMSGAPDLLAPLYGVVLYGLFGIPFGLLAAIATSALEKFWDEQTEGVAWAIGASAVITPLGLFILRYQANKVLFAEQGVPMNAMLAILVGIAVVDLVLIFGVARLLDGPLEVLVTGPGFLGMLAVLGLGTGGISTVQMGEDPRASFASGKALPASLQDHPDILVIMVDTLRADYLGSYGGEDVAIGPVSPVLDSLAEDGILFEQHIAQASWTRSSGASLMTSRLPSAHNAGRKADRLADGVTLYSEALSAEGVTTGALINNINLTSTFGFDQGWDTFIYESPAYAFGATESVFALTMYKVVHKLNERLFGHHKVVESFYQPAEVVLDDAKGFISANDSTRWSLFVHLMEPHDPYFEHPNIAGEGDAEFNGVGFARAEVEHPENTPENIDYLKRIYRDEIRFMDDRLAPFIAWLKSEGHYDDLMIVVTADHGEEFGEHGGFWHGTTLYDEQIRIPLIIKLPAQELAGTRVTWQSRSLDVAPTLTAAMGITVPDEWGWEGRDLIADVRDQHAGPQAWVDRLQSGTALESVRNEPPKGYRVVDVAADTDLAAGTRLTDDRWLLAVAEDRVSLLVPVEMEVPGELGADEDPEGEEDAPSEEETEEEEEEGIVLDAAPALGPCDVWGNPRGRTAVAEEDFEGNFIQAIRKGGAKYIQARAGGPRGLPEKELFDLTTDAGEKTNAIDAGSAICGNYAEDLSEELVLVIKQAEQRAMGGGKACISEAEFLQLKALGYVEGDAEWEPCQE